MVLIRVVLNFIAEHKVPRVGNSSSLLSVFQSIENLSVESGGSGPEKDDSPGRMDHTAAVFRCSPVLLPYFLGYLR